MRTAEQLDRMRQENMDYFGFGPRAMRRIKVCAHCGAMSPSTQWFCRECGKRLPRNTLFQLYKEQHKSCPTCETVIASSYHYCPQCGTMLEGIGEPPSEGGGGL